MYVADFPQLPPPPPADAVHPLRRLIRHVHVKRRARSLAKWVTTPRATLRAHRIEQEDAFRAQALESPADLLPRIQRARRRQPDGLFLAQAEALLTARSAGWRAAAPLFRQLANDVRNGRLKGPAAVDLLAPERIAAVGEVVVPAAGRPIFLPRETAARIVVYTVAAGQRPPLHPALGMPSGLRFLCFTEQEVTAPGWEIRPLAEDRPASFHKICPYEALRGAAPGADWSLYIAPDQLIMGNLEALLTRWLLPQPFALWRHRACADWHDLAERQLLDGTAAPAAVLAHAEACAATAVPRDRGVFDTSVLWRRHDDPAVTRLMDAWWALEEQAPGADALSLCRAIHGAAGTGVPRVMPEALGGPAFNIWFGRYTRPPLWQRAAPALRNGRVPVTFLYSDRWPDHGITIMRGKQLSRMIAERYPDRYAVTYTPDLESVRDQVVIVNRGAIQGNDAATLAALKARNPLVISDWQDLPLQPSKIGLFDAHMTMSPLQTIDMSRRFPQTPSFYVTHHVNPDVPRAKPPTDRLRAVYFGLLDNTALPGTLAGAVDCVSVTGAAFTAQHWQAMAPNYNCHWIVRRISRWEWHKPFLKGFVAARCGSAVIVTRDDMNAAYYLGDDYPFYAETDALPDLEMAWARAASGFGGPEWALALDIMAQVDARCSDEQVCTEFRFMLDELLR